MAPATDMHEITVWATPEAPTRLSVPVGKPPEYVLCRMVQMREGEFRLEPVTVDMWVKMKENFCRSLGIELSDATLKRLGRAGFVQMSFPGPQAILVNVQSLLEHLKNTASPRWWTRERRLQYLQACDDPWRLRGNEAPEH